MPPQMYLSKMHSTGRLDESKVRGWPSSSSRGPTRQCSEPKNVSPDKCWLRSSPRSWTFLCHSMVQGTGHRARDGSGHLHPRLHSVALLLESFSGPVSPPVKRGIGLVHHPLCLEMGSQGRERWTVTVTRRHSWHLVPKCYGTECPALSRQVPHNGEPCPLQRRQGRNCPVEKP